MSKLNRDLIDKVVQNCFNLYNKLPKTGKPIEKEWTVISCFLKYDRSNENVEVVSLGSGSKCIGSSKMSPKGDILNDSHAEIIARRAFLLYLYDNLYRAIKGETSIFYKDLDLFKLKDNIEFTFYSSQLPCGDASIIPKNGEEEFYGDILKQQKRQAECDINNTQTKRMKVDTDIHRTGAKCLPHCEQDSKEAGTSYHLLGQVRTKPGRGDRTLSVSCSDKISKWIHLGVQGSLIDILCGPIFVKYFIFGGGVPYSEESLNRALLYRNKEIKTQLHVVPEFYQTSLIFTNIRDKQHTRPAPGSIVWVKSNELLEVAVQGKKLGVTKKKVILPSSSLCISKYNIYRHFLNIVDNSQHFKYVLCDLNNINSIPYNVMKNKSVRYKTNWEDLKNNFFKTWTVKPDMWDFCGNIS